MFGSVLFFLLRLRNKRLSIPLLWQVHCFFNTTIIIDMWCFFGLNDLQMHWSNLKLLMVLLSGWIKYVKCCWPITKSHQTFILYMRSRWNSNYFILQIIGNKTLFFPNRFYFYQHFSVTLCVNIKSILWFQKNVWC